MTTATNLGVQAAARFKDPSFRVITAANWLIYTNMAYKKANNRSPFWPWNEIAEATVTVPDTGTPGAVNNRAAALPADTLAVNWAYDVTDDYRLVPQEGRGDQWHQDHLRSEVGQPVTYRLRNNKIELFPTPNVATVVAFEAVTAPVVLAGGDSPAWPSTFHDTLVEGMLYYAYLDTGNTAQATAHLTEYENGIKDMLNFVQNARTETYVPVRDVMWS